MSKAAASVQAARAIDAEIGAEEAAALIGRTTRRVRQLVAERFVSRTTRGRYRIVDVARGHAACLEQERAGQSATEANERVRIARAREIELRNAKEEGRLIDADDVEAIFSEILNTHRAEMSGVPAAATRDLPLREKIRDAIDAAMNRAAERFAARRAELGALAEAAEKSNTAPVQSLRSDGQAAARDQAGRRRSKHGRVAR